jgi:hypothetical protein
VANHAGGSSLSLLPLLLLLLLVLQLLFNGCNERNATLGAVDGAATLAATFIE